MTVSLHIILKTGRVPALASALFMALAPVVPQAQTPVPEPAAENKGKFGIEYKLDFRPEKPFYQKDMSTARPILDQMIANKGPDNFLRDFGWEKFENDAAWATDYIKACRQRGFSDLMRAMEKTSRDVDQRAQAIQKIHDEIKKSYEIKNNRWEVLLAGDDVLDRLFKGLLSKYTGIQANKFFGWVSKLLEARKMPGGSMAASATGKALGAIGTVIAIYQFFMAYDEYAEMQMLFTEQLEMLEVMAYLKVLLRQYDDLLGAQDPILEAIQDDFIGHRCQKCRKE